MGAGVISMSLDFQDGTTETIGNILQNGGVENLTILSSHTNPRAGVLVEYVPAPSYPRTYPYTRVHRTFLLVQGPVFLSHKFLEYYSEDFKNTP